MTIRRCLNESGGLYYTWGMKCIDTKSFVASTKYHVYQLNQSESSYLKKNGIKVPNTVCNHTHSPDDDCERMLIEFILIWEKQITNS